MATDKEIEAPLPPRPAWNSDFPIDRIEAQHVLRREFAKYLVFVAGGLAAGSAWVAVRDKLFPHEPIAVEHLICRTQDVPVGGTHAFTLPGSTVPYILINLGNDEWRAFEQKCTHLSCAVFYQPKEGKIECPCHNGWFDARTGAPLQGPPQRPLPQLQLEVRGGEIFVMPSKHEEHSA
jgi:Rieske Fe-S protein